MGKRSRAVQGLMRLGAFNKARAFNKDGGVQAPSTFNLVRYMNKKGVSYGTKRVQKMKILSLPTCSRRGRGKIIEKGESDVLRFSFDHPPRDPTTMRCKGQNGFNFILKTLVRA